MQKLTIEEISEILAMLESDIIPEYVSSMSEQAKTTYDRLKSVTHSEEEFAVAFTTFVSIEAMKNAIAIILVLTQTDLNLVKAIDKRQLRDLLNRLLS